MGGSKGKLSADAKEDSFMSLEEMLIFFNGFEGTKFCLTTIGYFFLSQFLSFIKS